MESSSVTNYSDGERVERLLNRFKEEYGKVPLAVVRVPGRVNLIGEHIDYCGYAVHPMAIEQDVLIALDYDKQLTPTIQLANSDQRYPKVTLDLKFPIEIATGQPHWWNYFLCGVKGVVEEFKMDNKCASMRCFIDGQIPPSAGLSSSSAIVVASSMATVVANDLNVTKEALADLCAKSERFIGTQGGGMDQAIELLAEKGSAKLIEFNPLQSFNVKLPEGAMFVIANSLAESNKAAGSDYNMRVVECRLAAKMLAKLLDISDWKSLTKLKDVQVNAGKDLHAMAAVVDELLKVQPYNKAEMCRILQVSPKELEDLCLTENTKGFDEFMLHSRAKHVYSEASRVYKFKMWCENQGKLEDIGQLMFDSHQSCSASYECSHPQLDKLVQLSKKHGALGARLTGAGWGGCIVALVPNEKVQLFMDGLQKEYFQDVKAAQEQPRNSYLFPTQPGAGAAIYKI